MESLDLQKQWNNLVVASGIEIGSTRVYFNDLCQAYGEPHRHYHTLDHINQMLHWLNEAGVDDTAALWATWYHDYVYSPGKKDNESRSGVKAGEVLLELGVHSSVVDRVVIMIEATRDHKTMGLVDNNLHFVLDADMAILGVEEQRYEQYREAVRKEFKSVPCFLYKRGRNSFLESVLNQEKIFVSSWFQERFEVRARENIKMELSIL